MKVGCCSFISSKNEAKNRHFKLYDRIYRFHSRMTSEENLIGRQTQLAQLLTKSDRMLSIVIIFLFLPESSYRLSETERRRLIRLLILMCRGRVCSRIPLIYNIFLSESPQCKIYYGSVELKENIYSVRCNHYLTASNFIRFTKMSRLWVTWASHAISSQIPKFRYLLISWNVILIFCL